MSTRLTAICCLCTRQETTQLATRCVCNHILHHGARGIHSLPPSQTEMLTCFSACTAIEFPLARVDETIDQIVCEYTLMRFVDGSWLMEHRKSPSVCRQQVRSVYMSNEPSHSYSGTPLDWLNAAKQPH